MRVTTVDYHTAGEPLRIVTAGLPDIPGESMLAKRRFMQSNLDDYRRLLMLEPRGHADMYGAVITEAVTQDGDIGVLFMHNEGYSTMCGHGIIALVTAGLERGLFETRDPDTVRIDTPAGRITARVNRGGNDLIDSVTFRNVPAFVLHDKCRVTVDGKAFFATVAYGGAFYAYVDADDFGLDLIPPEAPDLIALGQKIKAAVAAAVDVCHPQGGADLGFLYGTIFVKLGAVPNQSRNVCVFAEGELDRSPTGTGVCGRAAIHYAAGEIALGDELRIESIIGTAFRVRCIEQTQAGGLAAVVPEVTGSAHVSGEHTFLRDSMDPLPNGFFIR